MDRRKLSFITCSGALLFVAAAYFHFSFNGNREVASINLVSNAELCAEKMLKVKIIDKSWKTSPEVATSIEDAFKVCLSGLIQLKTISPEGHEELMVEFLEIVFTAMDIPHKRFMVDDLTTRGTRTNFIATLPHNFTESNSFDWTQKPNVKSIILLNHMDVVDANPEQWEKPEYAFSGAIAPSKGEPNRDFIWGRGALDMKGIGMTQIMNMWILKQLNIPMKRDVHFLAVADEEQSGSGAIGTLRKMKEGSELFALTEVSLVLNEGGGGIENTPKEGWDLFLVAVEEKGGAWMEFKEQNPIQLLKDLYKSKILNINDRITKKDKKITGHGCELLEIETPQPKVNVVASKITASFKCREGMEVEALFASVFKHEFETVKVKVAQEGSLVQLSVETQSSSHGSTGINESAITAFVMGLYHLDIFHVKKDKRTPKYFSYLKTDATSKLIKVLGESNFLIRVINKLSFIPFLRKTLLSEVEGEFGIDGLFRTSCQFSALSFKNNEANALVDCRLLHTAMKGDSHTQAQDFMGQLEKQIDNKFLSIKLIEGWDVSQSPINTPDYRVIEKTLESYSVKGRAGNKVRAVPFLFPAGSDNTWFRNPYSAGADHVAAIPSYGFFPIFITAELLASFHGSNERFPVDQIVPTVERYNAVLSKLAMRDGSTFLRRVIRPIESEIEEHFKPKPKQKEPL
jgi:acetylornithine deacetylase/succinyl-diaminopimelate desuccinylase-like protein